MPRIAILRCGKLPSFVTWEIPNLEELFDEDRLLEQGFAAQGFQAESVVWNQQDIDWNRFDIALIRSTWDYIDERESFLRVLSQIESTSCRLFNPLAAVRWNIDKHYLFELQEWGIPIVPTRLAADAESDVLTGLFDARQAQSVVLKPTIGLGASHSLKVPLTELNETLASLRASRPQHEYLIQPFVETILTEGEWSFIYFNRQLSHVFLKKPAPNDYRVQGIYGGTVQPAEPRPNDLLQAEDVISSLPFDLLYSRLDFVRVDGHLAVIEIELIEPIFGFNLVPESVARLVNATLSKFERRK